MNRPIPKPDQNGFASFLVLLVLVIVTSLLLDGAIRARVERQHTWTMIARVKARIAAEAGLAHALSRLETIHASEIGQLPGSTFARWNQVDALGSEMSDVRLTDELFYSVRMRDLSARIPVHTADAAALAAIFTRLGIPDHSAAAAADELVQSRVASSRIALGAIPDEMDHLVRIRSVPELRSIEPLTNLTAAARSYLTFVGPGTVNLNTAPAQVLESLPGFSAEASQLVLDRRSRGVWIRHVLDIYDELSEQGRETLDNGFSDLSGLVSYVPAAVEIESVGRLSSSEEAVRLLAVVGRGGPTLQVVWRTESSLAEVRP